MTKPKPGAYRPFVSARAPKGRPVAAPAWRLLVHRQYAGVWLNVADRDGLENAQQFYDHITQSPDQHPKVGTSGLVSGNHNKGKNGWSRRVHYEITGAGRIDYEFHPTYKTSDDGDEHPVVCILVINLGSHRATPGRPAPYRGLINQGRRKPGRPGAGACVPTLRFHSGQRAGGREDP